MLWHVMNSRMREKLSKVTNRTVRLAVFQRWLRVSYMRGDQTSQRLEGNSGVFWGEELAVPAVSR